MVRPSSLLARLFRRRPETAAGDRVTPGDGKAETPAPGTPLAGPARPATPTSRLEGALKGNAPVTPVKENGPSRVQVEAVRVETAPRPTEPAPKPAEPRDIRTKKMAPQEELSLKVTEGLNTLSGLLSNIDDKMATQNRKNQEIAEGVRLLPRVMEGMVGLQKTNLEVLHGIRDAVNDQGRAQKTSAENLAKLPGKLDDLGGKVEAQAKGHGEVKTSVEAVGKSVRGLADTSQRAQNTLLAEFRRSQDEHARRLEDLVERERKTMLLVSGLGLLVVVCLVLILVNNGAS